MQEERLLTVSQFNAVTKAIIENDPLLADVTVVGEISNFKVYPSGHLYFTLKDEESALACAMFKNYTFSLRIRPSNGMKVRVRGTATIYGKDGRYQFLVKSMTADGVGGLYAAYEALKVKLENEGLFDGAHKSSLPRFPRRIGVITSIAGAAYRDILNVTGRRFPSAEVILYPAAVQGEEAPEQLLAGVLYFEEKMNVDLIIIGRGGGSIEDLWAFNDEKLARALFACRIPTISAVGHETDFTICDFVCDRRAPTPSAAAELAVPDRAELVNGLTLFESRMEKAISGFICGKKERLRQISECRVLADRATPLRIKRDRFEGLENRLRLAFRNCSEKKKSALAEKSGKMVSLNPMAVLSRGYSAVFNGNGETVRSAKDLKSGEELQLKLYDGEAKVGVKQTRIYEGEKNGEGNR